jgi:Ni,Fe-hydrogenase I cytochrome b subunit
MLMSFTFLMTKTAHKALMRHAAWTFCIMQVIVILDGVLLHGTHAHRQKWAFAFTP